MDTSISLNDKDDEDRKAKPNAQIMAREWPSLHLNQI